MSSSERMDGSSCRPCGPQSTAGCCGCGGFLFFRCRAKRSHQRSYQTFGEKKRGNFGERLTDYDRLGLGFPISRQKCSEQARIRTPSAQWGLPNLPRMSKDQGCIFGDAYLHWKVWTLWATGWGVRTGTRCGLEGLGRHLPETVLGTAWNSLSSFTHITNLYSSLSCRCTIHYQLIYQDSFQDILPLSFRHSAQLHESSESASLGSQNDSRCPRRARPRRISAVCNQQPLPVPGRK